MKALRNDFFRGPLLAAVLICALLPAVVAAAEPTADQARLRAIDNILSQAKELRADKHLPRAWQTARAAYEAAEDGLGGDGVAMDPRRWPQLADEARLLASRLLARARYVSEMRDERSGYESMMNAYDLALKDLSLAADLPLDPDLVGPAAGSDLARRLGERNLSQRVRADSLTISNRAMRSRLNALEAAHDSVVTGLQVEISSLRDQLWQTQLRAGVAEADRSAVESQLERRRRREETIRERGSAFGQDEGEMLLTTGGDVIIRVFGFSFGVGSAELGASDDLVDKVVAAIGAFPGCRMRVGGHTDDTGSRNANLRLSRRRAETVARMLAEQLEMPLERVEIIGHGPDRPVATNETPEGRARNRRIEILLLTGEQD